MAKQPIHHKPNWWSVSMQLIAYGILCVVGLIVSAHYGKVRIGDFNHKILALCGVIVFLFFSIELLHALTRAIRKTIVYHRLGVGRAAALQFIIRLFGYLTILFITLDHLGVPIGHVLLGSAVLGIILGVAAQQALANFFASIVLIVSHPFSVGDTVTLISGGLGGAYTGTIVDIGVTHTHLQEKNGERVALPNSTLLTGAAITVHTEAEQ